MRQPAKQRPKQPGIQIQVRVQPEQVALLDAWIEAQPEPHPSRPEAIRRLLDAALAKASPKPYDQFAYLFEMLPREDSLDEARKVMELLSDMIASESKALSRLKSGT